MSASKPIQVLYQPLVDGEGLALDEGRVLAYTRGQPVGQAEVHELARLDDLLASYRVPDLLPELEFRYGPFVEAVVMISIDFVFPERQEVAGEVELDGAAHTFVARLEQGHVEASAQSARLRPWASHLPTGAAFRVGLSPRLLALEQVVRQRLALTVEYLCSEVDFAAPAGERAPKPHRYRLDNTFSAAQPMWREDLPPVAPLSTFG